MAIAKPDMSLLWGESGINVVQPANQQIIDGWVAEKPPYQTENWVQNRSDVYLKHIDSKGVPEWGSISEYDIGSMAMYGNQLWESLQDSNVNHIPTDGAGWWQSWQPLDKKRAGLMEETVNFVNNKGIAGRFTDNSTSWLTYIYSDNNVYMGAINDPNALNTSVNIMQGGVVRSVIRGDYTQWNTAIRSLIIPSNPADLCRKDYTDSGDAATLASANTYTNDQIGAATTPTGAIMAWPLPAPPFGFLLCQGQAISRSVYANLFALLGISYGPGDGSTTFNLPDYRGEFLRGHDDGRGADQDAGIRTNRGDGTAGDAVGTKQSWAIQNIAGSITQILRNQSPPSVPQTTGPFGWSGYVVDSDGGEARQGGTISFDASKQVQTSTSETRGRNVSVSWIIKT